MPTILDLEIMGRVVLAGLLGALVGYERQLRRRPAGLRTFTMVSMGAALFTVVSIYGFPAAGGGAPDPSRVAAQVVTGIGFIGAGIVLRRAEEGLVVGLTTAASVWSIAAVGLAAGAGLYWVAIFSTVLMVGVLYLVRRWELHLRHEEREE